MTNANQYQAAKRSPFDSGWRPFIGWLCGVGFGYHVIIYPILDIWHTMPDTDDSLLITVMGGLLGYGTLRTTEKIKGVSREK